MFILFLSMPLEQKEKLHILQWREMKCYFPRMPPPPKKKVLSSIANTYMIQSNLRNFEHDQVQLARVKGTFNATVEINFYKIIYLLHL